MKFKTIVCVTYYQEVTVEADSIEEAEELFHGADGERA